MTALAERAGLLVLVVGPSGAGKDSVIDGAIRQAAPEDRLCKVRRVITRPPGETGEDHSALDADAFDLLKRSGAFALSWEAHGLHYGVPADISGKLDAGHVVIANVSRTVIGEARRKFPSLLVVEITARPEVLRERIAARGRASDGDIDARLSRMLENPAPADHVIVNEGPLDAAISRLSGLIARTAA